jgi:phosphohistidine phosphatase SixA
VILLLRHASAGSRLAWEEDDRERPLDERGEQQALGLVSLLARFEVDAILTSPYRRCVQTVEPLAAARLLPVELRTELGEAEQQEAGAELVRSLAGRNVAVCGHGGLEWAVVQEPPKWRKGETLVLDRNLSVVETLRDP